MERAAGSIRRPVPCPDDRLARVIQCHLTGRVLYAIANPKQVIVQTMGVGLGTGAMVHIFRKTLRAASVFLDLEVLNVSV
jgi:hypothetical protein